MRERHEKKDTQRENKNEEIERQIGSNRINLHSKCMISMANDYQSCVLEPCARTHFIKSKIFKAEEEKVK